MTKPKTSQALAIEIRCAADDYADAVGRVAKVENELFDVKATRDRLKHRLAEVIREAEQRISVAELPNCPAPDGKATP